MMEMIRLIIHDKTSTSTESENESDTASTARILPHRPYVTKILQQYLTFDLDDSSSGPSVRNEFVVLKEYHTPLESIEKLPI